MGAISPVSGVPSIAESARAALRAGFDALDKGAAEVVAGTTVPTDVSEVPPGPADGGGAGDALVAGLLDLTRAQLMVGAGAALVRADQKRMDDLLGILEPDRKKPR